MKGPTRFERRVALMIREGRTFTLDDIGCAPRTLTAIWRTAHLSRTGRGEGTVYFGTADSDAWCREIAARGREYRSTPRTRLLRKFAKARKAGLIP